MLADWEIKSRARACTKSGREFEPGEVFYTLLIREKSGFRREDLCEQAWKERGEEEEQPFSFWKSKYEPPTPPPPEPMKKDDAEGLLRTMLASGDPAHRNASYILALMLERKRVLRPLESADPEMLVYERASTGETFVLPNPHLRLEQIPEVQQEVAQLLASPAAP